MNVFIFYLHVASDGALFGDPNGSSRQKVVLYTLTRAQVLNVERTYNESPERLATGLLLLLFTSDELSCGNCTKPMRKDINQLDSERLWAIKCKE